MLINCTHLSRSAAGLPRTGSHLFCGSAAEEVHHSIQVIFVSGNSLVLCWIQTACSGLCGLLMIYGQVTAFTSLFNRSKLEQLDCPKPSIMICCPSMWTFPNLILMFIHIFYSDNHLALSCFIWNFLDRGSCDHVLPTMKFKPLIDLHLPAISLQIWNIYIYFFLCNNVIQFSQLLWIYNDFSLTSNLFKVFRWILHETCGSEYLHYTLMLG